jgi:hypothetical protein
VVLVGGWLRKCLTEDTRGLRRLTSRAVVLDNLLLGREAVLQLLGGRGELLLLWRHD